MPENQTPMILVACHSWFLSLSGNQLEALENIFTVQVTVLSVFPFSVIPATLSAF